MRSYEWSTRMLHEAAYHQGSVFLTLTYSDEALPDPPVVQRRVLQLYLKRLRKRLAPRRIKYYGVGEYGEQYARPHYHLIVFGLGLWEHQIRKVQQGYHCLDGPAYRAWGHGLVGIDTISAATCRYVSNYIQKDRMAYGPWTYKEGKPFQVQSQGIGKQYVLDNMDRLKKKLALTKEGKDYGLPKYYTKKLKEEKEIGIWGTKTLINDPELIMKRMKENGEERRREVVEEKTAQGMAEEDIFAYSIADNYQRRKMILAKERIGRQK